MLSLIGRHGRHALIAGLILGLAAPGLAETLRPWVGEAIAALLLVTAIRIGARDALARLDGGRRTLGYLLALQLGLPLGLWSVLAALGLAGHPLALSVILLTAAPSLTGAPNFAVMAGGEPAYGLRLLILGTALFPLTSLPVLLVLGLGGGVLAALGQTAVLALAIFGAVGLGFALRYLRPGLGSPERRETLDGVAAVLLVLAVVGLMSEIGPLVRRDPGAFAVWLVAALAINAALQAGARVAFAGLPRDRRLALSIMAGNRNIALFLVALPPEVTAPLMVFIGCYQIPMYLTPTVLRRIEARAR